MKRLAHLNRAQSLMLLNRIPFFKAFTVQEREKIVDQKTSFISANKNEYIIEEGTLDTAFYILLTGEAEVTSSRTGRIGLLNPGDFFGEFSFLENLPRSSDVVAKDTCILLKVDRRLLGTLSAEIREKVKDQIIHKLVAIITDHKKTNDKSKKTPSLGPQDLDY